MLIIFLDIDLTMSNHPFLLSNKNNINSNKYTVEEICETQVDPKNVKNLNKILTVIEDANIVLSSSWRRFVTLKQLTDGLNKNGLNKKFNDRFIDKTPITGQKHEEINQWLKDTKEKVDNYVILDDSRDKYDDLKSFGDHWIKINPDKGLSPKKTEKSINFLLNTNSK